MLTTPTIPPPPVWASGQQLVANGAALGSLWAPKACHAPWAPKLPEGKFCPLCTPPLFGNTTLMLTPTQTLNVVPTLPLSLALAITQTLTIKLTLVLAPTLILPLTLG